MGSRQLGRITGATVLHCGEELADLKDALQHALSAKFREKCVNTINPYGDGCSSDRILNKICDYPLADLLVKKFYDIG